MSHFFFNSHHHHHYHDDADNTDNEDNNDNDNDNDNNDDNDNDNQYLLVPPPFLSDSADSSGVRWNGTRLRWTPPDSGGVQTGK
jgi:hypothetical protein